MHTFMCSRGPLISARIQLLSVVPCVCAPPTRAHQPWAGASRRPPRYAPLLSALLSLPRELHPRPPTPSPSTAARRTDKRHHRCRPPLSFPPSLPPLQARHEHHFTPPTSYPRPTVRGTPTPPEVKPSSPPTAPFSELPPQAIVALRRRPPLIPRLLLQLQDPIAALLGHRNSLAAVEAQPRRTVSPPHHHRPSPVRTAPPHLARRHLGDTMVLTGKTLPLTDHRRATGERATMRSLRAVTARPRRPRALAGQNGSWARPTLPGLGLKCRPSTVRRFF
jgi:hypothetical protein